MTETWYEPRFPDPGEAMRNAFRIVPDEHAASAGRKRYKILNVPVFKTYRSRNHSCDEAYLDKMVSNFYMPIAGTQAIAGEDVAERFAFRPKIHLHHTSDDPKDPRPEVVGHIEHLYRSGPFLFADFAGIDEHTLEILRSSKYPDRSAEVDPKRGRLLSVALLGAEAPHFALPQMRNFGYSEKVERHNFNGDEFTMSTSTKTLSPIEAFQLFRDLPEGHPKKVEFDRRFQKHMGMMDGGGMGMGQLESLIHQVIMQMAGQKFNQTPTTASEGYSSPLPAGGGGAMSGGMGGGRYSLDQAVHDLLDLEDGASVHNASIEEVEEGTKVRTTEDNLARNPAGKKAGDSGVTKRGQPSDSSYAEGLPKDVGPDEFSDQAEESGLQKNSMDIALRTIRHRLSNVGDDQLTTAVNELVSGVDRHRHALQRVAEANRKMHNEVQHLITESEKHKKAERLARIRNKLISLRAQHYVGVGDESGIEEHVQLLAELPDERHESYYNRIKAAGKVMPGDRPVLHGREVSETNAYQERVQRHKARIEQDPEARAFAKDVGLSAEDFALVDMMEGLSAETERDPFGEQD